MKFKVELERRGYSYLSDEPYVEALRQIIEHNANVAAMNSVSSRIATKCLVEHGFVVKVLQDRSE